MINSSNTNCHNHCKSTTVDYYDDYTYLVLLYLMINLRLIRLIKFYYTQTRVGESKLTERINRYIIPQVRII